MRDFAARRQKRRELSWFNLKFDLDFPLRTFASY
jgi:hypothetical protein